MSYYIYNGHGDVIQTVDENGKLQNQYVFDAFGNETFNHEEVSNSIRYSGEFYDVSTGLYYLRARYYNPTIGRFISEDSYWGEDNNPASLNLYTYCYNDPVQFVDPTGHYGGKNNDRDDSTLSVEDQRRIKQLTDSYYTTDNKELKEELHKEAEKIRTKADRTYRKNKNHRYNNDSFTREIDKVVKKNIEEGKGAWLSKEQWKSLSTRHNRRSKGIDADINNDDSSSEYAYKEIIQIRDRVNENVIYSDYTLGSKENIEELNLIREIHNSNGEDGNKASFLQMSIDMLKYSHELNNRDKQISYSEMIENVTKGNLGISFLTDLESKYNEFISNYTSDKYID